MNRKAHKAGRNFQIQQSTCEDVKVPRASLASALASSSLSLKLSNYTATSSSKCLYTYTTINSILTSWAHQMPHWLSCSTWEDNSHWCFTGQLTFLSSNQHCGGTETQNNKNNLFHSHSSRFNPGVSWYQKTHAAKANSLRSQHVNPW